MVNEAKKVGLQDDTKQSKIIKLNWTDTNIATNNTSWKTQDLYFLWMHDFNDGITTQEMKQPT